MKKLFVILALTAFTATVRGQVLIYKQNLTATRNGAGTSQAWKLTGFELFDMQAERLVMFGIDVKSKRFTVYEHPVWVTRPVFNGKTSSLFLAINDGHFNDLRAKGINKLNDIGAGKTMIPSSLVASGINIFDHNTDYYSAEYKGNFVYDKKDTITAQQTAQTLDQTVEKFREQYFGKGYSEIDIDDVLPF